MKHSLTVLAACAALALTGCASAAPAPFAAPSAPPAAATTAPVAEAVESIPAYTPVVAEAPEVDVTRDKTFTFVDGLAITFDSATIATADQIGSDPVEGKQAVILAFTYKNGAPGPISLQPVQFDVSYGADLYAADQPTLYQGDSTHTDLAQRISAGSTVKVVDTYWIPKGEPISVKVNVSGSEDQVRATPIFTGITAP